MPQSWLKRIVFLSYAPIGVLAGLGFGWQYFPGLVSQGDSFEKLNSPDGKFRASIWHRDGCWGKYVLCDSAKGDTSVVLEHKFGPISLGAASIFQANAAASDVQIRWTGPSALSISCQKCVENGSVENDDVGPAVAIKYEESPN